MGWKEGNGRVGVKQWGEGEEGGNGRPAMHIMERRCAADVRCKDKDKDVGSWRMEWRRMTLAHVSVCKCWVGASQRW